MQQCSFNARDGKTLAYRWFEGTQDVVVVCLHGSNMDSRQYVNFAKVLQANGINVCLPDWRGHGESEGRFGDTEYIGQLEDDLADLLNHLATGSGKEKKLLVGGHSAGSLIALRYIDNYGCKQISGYFSIAPPLTQGHETRKYDLEKNDWQFSLRYFRKKPYHRNLPVQTEKFLPKLSILKYILAGWIPLFRHNVVMKFPNMGKPDNDQKQGYSFNLLSSYAVANYPDAFSKIAVPCYLIVGENDDVISPNILECIFNWYVSPFIAKTFKLIPKTNHISVVTSASKLIASWASLVAENESEVVA